MADENKIVEIDGVVNALDTYVKTEVSNLKDRLVDDLRQEVEWRKSSIQELSENVDERIAALNDKIGDGTKELTGSLGNISELKTEVKDDIVSAINSQVD